MLFAVLASGAYAWQAHTIEQLSARHSLAETAAVLFAGASMILLPAGIGGIETVTATPQAMIGAVYLGLFTTAIAYGAFAFGIPRLGARQPPSHCRFWNPSPRRCCRPDRPSSSQPGQPPAS